mmetsp:Transcript_10875/g.19474  ORF Transcript_10875/g.19474 Transcript_10875/m.19474 type:complete len:242 (+) Transcript_10875:3-728(+)
MYVAERIVWFFQCQKNTVMELMDSLDSGEGSAMRKKMFPAHFPRIVKMIKANEMMKHLIFETYDQAARRQLQSFVDMFQNMLSSTFANPWAFLKGGTQSEIGDGEREEPEMRIPKEIESRSGIEVTLSKWLQDIPTESHQIDEAVDKVQMLVLKIYSLIRSQVCDQVELFAESFFKLPMLRRLQADMKDIDLSDADKENYAARRSRIKDEETETDENFKEITTCLNLLREFKVKCEMKSQF